MTVFLVANPDERSGGGEANGGRLVVEVAADSIDTLLHESLHRLLDPKRELIQSAAEAAGLEFELLNEGIAYPLSPGITADTEQGDRLIEQLVRMQLRGKPASDPYLQFDLLAPLLRAALAHKETITTFLPQAIDKWRSVVPRKPS